MAKKRAIRKIITIFVSYVRQEVVQVIVQHHV